MRFAIGLVCGLAVLGAYVGYQQIELREKPCGDHCGVGTECVEGVCLIPQPAATIARKKRKRRWRGRARPRRIPAGSSVAAAGSTNDTTDDTVDDAVDEDPPLRKPTAADLRVTTQGPALRQTDYVDLARGGAAGGRELSSAEINARVRRLDLRIVACIDRTRGDLDISSGKVQVGFRVERTGKVDKLQVSAPAALMRRGLFGCLRPLFTGLSFGPTNRALIMTYPYALN